MIHSPHLSRVTLAILLALWGLLLRFGPQRREPVFPFPWTKADPVIGARTNRRVGLLLVCWAAWLFASLAIAFRGTLLGMLVAPFVLVVLLSGSYAARLYVQRYETLQVRRIRKHADRPIPRGGGWPIVIVREILPMLALLVPILLIHAQIGDLPDRIPVRLSFFEGPTDWRLKHDALTFLRGQTRFVYLASLLGETGYLVWKWAGKAQQNLAERLLTPQHWKYFFFRTGWVALSGGINLGCAAFAAQDQSLVPYLTPGVILIAAVGALSWWDHRRTTYVPPPRPTEP